MPGILIDLNKLKKYKLDNLINYVDKYPKTNHIVGIIFIIDNKTFKKLTSITSSDLKKSYLNSKQFINTIKYTHFVIYDKKKRLIELYCPDDYLNEILYALILFAPRDVIIWSGIVPNKKSKIFIKSGFSNPYLTDKSPLGYKFDNKGFAFTKKNIPSKNINISSSQNVVDYIKSQIPRKSCIIYARFTPKAVKYLKNLNKSFLVMGNKKLSEKELAGSLKVSKVVNINNKIIFELSGVPESVQTGAEEEVDAVWSRYNFHTHPKKAYVNHNVTNGWPSSQDYLGFVQLNNHTIFHTVVTLEGIYIISFTPEWIGKVKNMDHKYILKHYDIDHNKKISFQEYIDIINKKQYKNNPPLFSVKYISWDGDTSQVFPIFYKKTGENCLATDEAFEQYKKLYK